MEILYSDSTDYPKVDSLTKEPRGKRTRQQHGFYATLLNGGAIPAKRNKKEQKQLPTAVKSEEESESGSHFVKDIKIKDAAGEIKDGTLDQSRTNTPTSDQDRQSGEGEKSSPSVLSQETVVKSEDVSMVAGWGQNQHKDEVLVKNVVAVVQDSSVSSQAVTDFLHDDSFPQQRSEVQVEQSEGQVIIRGSIEEVQQVLNALAQIKSKPVADLIAAGETVEKETATTTAFIGDNNGCTPMVVSTPASEEAAECIQNEKKTIYIEDTDGISMLVSVDVPSTPHFPAVAADNPSTVATDNALRNQQSGDTVSEDVVCFDSFTDHSASAYEANSPHEGESSRAVDIRALVQRRPSPLVVGNRVLIRSRGSTPFVNIKAAGVSVQNRPSTSFGYDPSPKLPTPTELLNQLTVSTELDQTSSSTQTTVERVLKSKETQMGDNSSHTLPASLPGLLPLESSVRCGLCDEVCADAESVKRHMDVMHASHEEVFQCEVCSLVFPDKRTLLAHLKTKHEAADLSCQICGRKFQCQRYLRTHLQRHAGVKKFECPQCGWRFFERHKLNFHMELHKAEGERRLPYRCDLCGKQFSNKATWSDHCNTHSGLRPFVCTVCGAKFGHRVGLRRHKLTHDKVKAFQCKVCSKTFTVKPKLDEHMITHTGISKHACPTCHKVFTAASSLKRHAAKCSADAMLRTNQDSSTDSIQLSQDSSNCQDPDARSLFLCGTCSACFSTYHEAEQHALTNHQVLEDSVGSGCGDGMPNPSGISSAGVMVSSGDGHQRELTVNLKELEQIQLAASTLADLSTL